MSLKLAIGDVFISNPQLSFLINENILGKCLYLFVECIQLELGFVPRVFRQLSDSLGRSL